VIGLTRRGRRDRPNLIEPVQLTGGTVGNLSKQWRVNFSKKIVDDGNLTYFIIRYR
jgi:hypothetical protein